MIYFCNIHLKHLQYTSKTLETYTYNMCFQQNLTVRWAEHCTAGFGCAVAVAKEDDSGRVAARAPVTVALPR
jgi:nicotinamide mononucleotide (NMN) deamidase PncC